MLELTPQQIDRLLDLGERLVKLAESRFTPIYEVPNAEIWRQGEPGKKAETREEYRELPTTGPGRFSDYVSKGKPK